MAPNSWPNLKRTLKTPTPLRLSLSMSLPSPPLTTGGRTPAMAASPPPPSPPPPQARSPGGYGPVSLFLDTDLGTRLALLVAADSTIRHLKCTPLVASSPPLRPRKP